TVFGCVNTVGALGGILAGPLIGRVLTTFGHGDRPTADPAGWNTLFVLIAAANLASAACWLFINPDRPIVVAPREGPACVRRRPRPPAAVPRAPGARPPPRARGPAPGAQRSPHRPAGRPPPADGRCHAARGERRARLQRPVPVTRHPPPEAAAAPRTHCPAP